MSHLEPLSAEDFRLFQEFFVAETGLYFDNASDHLLLDAFQERMKVKGHASHKEYYHYLKYHPEGRIELRELLVLITTGETYFFRNIAQFEVLMNDVLPDIIRRKRAASDKSIRIWSAGSSRGDEAYSVAIAIMEVLPDFRDWDIRILGTDINRDVLAVARAGVYTPKDIGELPPDYVEKYFVRDRSDYVLSQDIKAMVRFDYHNLARDPFTQDVMKGLDIIFCRNVTIYFNLETTRELMARFYDSLLEGGYLFLGHSETLWQINHSFQTIEYPHTFIYKKGPRAVVPKAPVSSITLPVMAFEGDLPVRTASHDHKAPVARDEKPRPPVTSDMKADVLLTEATRLYQEKKYDVALATLDGIAVHHDEHARAEFLRAVIFADQEKYDKALAQIQRVVKKDSLNVEAAFFLATLYAKVGKLADAENLFRRVIYLEADEPLAYFHLGNIYTSQKKASKASLEFMNAVRILEKRKPDAPVRFSEDLSSGLLLQSCKHNLTPLPKAGGG